MRWLLWKEYRHNRLIVYTLLVMLLAPHFVALCATCRANFLHLAKASDWRDFFAASSLYSLIISQLAVVLIGGNAIAGERVDRSAEFLFSLPITRRRLLASKLLLAMIFIAAPLLVNGLILPCLLGTLRIDFPGETLASLLAVSAIAGIVCFCVAWFLSSLSTSTAFATLGGLFSPSLVMGGIALFDYVFDWQLQPKTMENLSMRICLALAPLFFALGTWHYLRRVEP